MRGSLNLPAFYTRLRKIQDLPAAKAKLELEMNQRCIAVYNLWATVKMHRDRVEPFVKKGHAGCAKAALAAIEERGKVPGDLRMSQFGVTKPRENRLYKWYMARNRALWCAGALCQAKSLLAAVESEFTQNAEFYQALREFIDELMQAERTARGEA
jgi:hypothetical protein